MNPRFLFLWPNAQVSMMEPDTLTEKALEVLETLLFTSPEIRFVSAENLKY